ncbi:MAG: TolC family protein [Alphaproteobacteria bacterium]|nr:TolC family protein [Alphaproteobacteria bacterium]
MIGLLLLSLIARADPGDLDPGASPSLDPGPPMDLEATRDAAIRSRLEVEAATARAEAARGDAAVALSGALPAVTAFGTLSTGAGRTASGFDRPVATQLGVGLSGSWTLVAPADWAGARAARATFRGREALIDWARVEARQAATRAFADVLATREAEAAWTRSLADAAEAADAVEQLVDAGLRPPAEGARARAEASSVEAALRAVEGERAEACATLLALVRELPRPACDVQPPTWTGIEPAPAPPRHPALVAAEEALAAARTDRTAAALGRAPTLEATGTVAAWGADGAALAPGWSVGLGADVPIVAGGALAGDQRRARAGADLAFVELEQQARDLVVARVAAEARLTAARAELAAREDALVAAQAGFDLVDARFTAGLEALQPWLDARRDRDAAAIGVARARQALLHALADTEATRGVW